MASLVAGSRSPKEANLQHREILQAVKAHDVEAARKLMLEHVHNTLIGVPELAES